MDLLEESRRFFKFRWDKDWQFDFGHIKANNGTVWFQRPAIPETHRFIFDSVESCKLWAYRFGMAMMKGFVANKRVDKPLYDVKSSALEIDDSEWIKVAKYMTNPDRFDRDSDIKIFESHLANNFRDRDGERFPKSVLKSFEKSIVGKGKLMGHKWGDPGNGRFYSAAVKKMSIEETVLFCGAQPDKNFKKHLEFIDDRDGGIFWLVTRYYMPNITDMQKEAIIYIESGVWKDMSIGFRAPLKFAIFEDGSEKLIKPSPFGGLLDEDENDSPILFLEFRNDKDLESEALEGSHVFLGSQIGAQTSKSVDDLKVQVNELTSKIDKVIGKLGRKKKDSGQPAVDSPQSIVDSLSAVDNLPESDLPLHEVMEKFYWDLVAQELGWWKSNNEPVTFDDFIFMCNRRGFEERHILFLIEELKKLNLAENLVVIAENIDKYFTYQYGDFLILSDEIETDELKYYVAELDKQLATEFLESEDTEKVLQGELKAVWTTAYINSLKDDCFAYVEDTGKHDDEGRTIPKTARHLPHHPKGGGASGTGGIIDLPHLRNALARVNKVNPVTDKVSAERLRSQAKSHLVAHTKKLNIGDYELVYDTIRREVGNNAGDSTESVDTNSSNENVNPIIINEEKIMKEFEFESLGVKLTVNDEKFDETMKALNDALIEKETAFNQKMTDLTQKVSDFEDQAAVTEEAVKTLTEQNKKLEGFDKSVKIIFGEDVTIEIMKRAKDTESLYREKEIARSFRFGGPIGLIKDEKKELELYNDMTTDQITRFADKYESDFNIQHPEFAGVLKANNETIVTNPEPEKEVKPEIEEPFHNYRW